MAGVVNLLIDGLYLRVKYFYFPVSHQGYPMKNYRLSDFLGLSFLCGAARFFYLRRHPAFTICPCLYQRGTVVGGGG